MSKHFLYFVLFFAIAGTWLVSCKKSNSNGPLEPISVIQPDSLTVQHFAGDSMPIKIEFTTDRPINFVQVLYEIDSSVVPNYQPSFPDTLIYLSLAMDTPRTNIYTASTLYRVPGNLQPFSVIYFEAYFTAGSSSFVTGQNYPAGIVSASKAFKVNIK